jgi:hypothetical protein
MKGGGTAFEAHMMPEAAAFAERNVVEIDTIVDYIASK